VLRKFSSKKIEVPDEPLDPNDKKPEPQIKVEPGLNRFVWDMRSEGASRVPEYHLWEYNNGRLGPKVMPGQYQVRLTVDGKSGTAPLEVKLDPRVKVDQADLQKQYDLLAQIHDELSKLYDAVNQIEDVRSQVKGIQKRLPDNKPVVDAGSAFDQKLVALRDDFVQRQIRANEDSLRYPQRVDSKLAYLAMAVGDGNDSAPTDGDYRLFDKLKKQADELLARWADVQKTDLTALQQLMAGHGVPAIVVAPADAVEGGGEQ